MINKKISTLLATDAEVQVPHYRRLNTTLHHREAEKETEMIHYFNFYTKSEKPIKAIICHLLNDTPAEDISNRSVDLRLCYKCQAVAIYPSSEVIILSFSPFY
jgi:hypothetical protein